MLPSASGYRAAYEAVLNEYVFTMVAAFTDDPPDSPFQEGFEKAAREIEAWLIERTKAP